MRAASVVPSFNGISMCSMTRTFLGKFVTIIEILQADAATESAETFDRRGDACPSPL
jgi:hypothetical protein